MQRRDDRGTMGRWNNMGAREATRRQSNEKKGPRDVKQRSLGRWYVFFLLISLFCYQQSFFKVLTTQQRVPKLWRCGNHHHHHTRKWPRSTATKWRQQGGGQRRWGGWWEGGQGQGQEVRRRQGDEAWNEEAKQHKKGSRDVVWHPWGCWYVFFFLFYYFITNKFF